MHGEEIAFGYGFWSLVLVNVAIFVLLALSYLYDRIARREEGDAEAAFGGAYRAYAARVPMFVPRLGAGHAAQPRWGER